MENTKPTEWDIDNIPNRLTIFRVFLIPFVIVPLFINSLEMESLIKHELTLGYIAAWTFAAASITDFFDGYIARKKGIVTVFGSFLDPIADKFLVVSSLIMLMHLGRIHVLIIVVLVLRELFITSLRLLAKDKGLSVPVGSMGKWKTATQMIGIPMLMAYDKPFGFSFPMVGSIFIYIACFLSVISAIDYTMNLLKKLKQKRKTDVRE